MRAPATITVVLLLACTTACGSTSSAQPAPDPTSKPASSKPAAEPRQDPGPRKLGTTWQWKDDDPEFGPVAGSITALSYKQPLTGPYPPDQAGEEWGRLTVKTCVTKGDVTVSQFGWSVAYEDGTRIEVTGSSGGDFPRPEFPMDAVVKPGDCAKGGIMFPVPKGQRPDRVVFAPEGAAEALEWKVPAK